MNSILSRLILLTIFAANIMIFPQTKLSSEQIILQNAQSRNQYKRLAEFYDQRFPAGDTVNLAKYQHLVESENNKLNSLESADPRLWENIGPDGIVSSFPQQWGIVSGRVRAIAVHPGDPNTVYVGASAGGIWKSTDGGASWHDIGRGMESLSFGAIAIDPQNPSIIYAGSGEAILYFNHVTFDGRGLFRSTDAGNTWTKINSGFGNFTHFSQIRVSPHNTDILYAALASGYSYLGGPGNEGIWRSTDKGFTWTRILGSDNGFDIVFDPISSSYIYAATNNSIYVSSNGGGNWSQAVTGISNSSAIGRVHFDITNTGQLFCVIYFTDSSMKVFKSTNKAASWTQVGQNFSSGQGWYDLLISVNPSDQNEIYAGEANLYRTTTGSTFSYVGGEYWSQSMHVDFHIMRFAPSNNSVRYAGCDGGIYRSSDGGATWVNINRGLRTLQYYRIASDPLDENIVFGGAQDNGNFRTTNGGSSNWTLVTTGDGMECFVDYIYPNIIYMSTQNGAFYKSTNGGGYGSFNYISPSFGSQPVAWTAPFMMHPSINSTLYCASDRIWRSTNSGSAWTAISPSLSGSAITSLDISPVQAVNMSAVVSSSGFWISTDGGVTWQNKSSSLPSPSSPLSRVKFSWTDPYTLYLVQTSFGTGKIFRSGNLGTTWQDISGNLPDVPASDIFIDPNDASHIYAANDLGVYHTTDGGGFWERAGTGMPVVPAIDFDYQVYDGNRRVLFAATHGRSAYKMLLDDSPENSSFSVSAGWNIISVPLKANDMSVSSLFPDAASSAFLFNNNYIPVSTLENGAGYWLKFNSGGIINITGSAVSFPVSVQQGWNIVGPFNSSLSASNVSSDPPGIIQTPFYSYSSGYVSSAALEPGKGYWLKTSQSGSLIFSEKIERKSGTEESQSAKTAVLTLTDASGRSVKLLLTEGVPDSYYELPPLPPAGNFDIRFSGNMYAANMYQECEILLSGADFPLSISASGTTVEVKLSDGTVEIIGETDPEIIIKKQPEWIKISSVEMPSVFSLSQNFPNPFNPQTKINYSIPSEAQVQIEIFNIMGENIKTLVNKTLQAGNYETEFSAENLSSGVYFYKITALTRGGERFGSVKKMMVLK